MGMRVYEYEEVVKYRYEYWEREAWLKSCLETLEKIGGRRGNWDMIDAVAMVFEMVQDRDRTEIVKARQMSRSDELTYQEGLEILERGGTVWLKDYAETNYGTEENPSYDYPLEDPGELMAFYEDGDFDGNDPIIILADPDEGDTGYNSALYYKGVRKVIQQRLDYTRQEIEDAEKVIEDY